MPVATVRHKNSQADLVIHDPSENPVFRCWRGLTALGQVDRRLCVGRHHRQLWALLQVVRHRLADLCRIIGASRLKMEGHQCSEGYGVEG